MSKGLLGLFEVSLTMSVVIIICLLLRPYFSKTFKAVFKYWIWLVIALRLMVPFNFVLPTNTPIQIQNKIIEIPTKKQGEELIKSLGTLPSSVKIQNQTRVIDNNPSLTFLEIVGWIWFGGVIVCWILAGTKYIRFMLLMNKESKVIEDKDKINLLRKCKSEIGIHRNIKFKQCNYAISPMLFGMFHPTIVLPSVELQDYQLDFVLRHELYHYKNHDLIYQFILFFVGVVHWFNPFVHQMIRVALEDIEQVCDERVVCLDSLETKQNYGYTILEIAKKNQVVKKPLISSFGSDKKSLKDRLIALGEMNKKKMNLPFLMIFLCGVLVSSCLVGCEIKASEPITTAKTRDVLIYDPVPQNFWEDNYFSNEYGYQKTLINEDGVMAYVQLIKKDLLVPKYFPNDHVYVEGRSIVQYTFKDTSDLIYDDVLKDSFVLPQQGDEVSQWEIGDYYGVIFGPTSQHNISRFVGALKLPDDIQAPIDTTWYYVVSDQYRYYTLGDNDVVIKVPDNLPEGFWINAYFYSDSFNMINVYYAPNGINERDCFGLFASIYIEPNKGEEPIGNEEILKKTEDWIIYEPVNKVRYDVGCDASGKMQLDEVKQMANNYEDVQLIEVVER
ncbi:M56 family metallopeptidase [Anaerorhabdus sp.]|uniref:M56 family metallopeptidase n=1 Tax=Anaerorhabdus sp. TaxID=1872524 RepID=UPI002FC760E5